MFFGLIVLANFQPAKQLDVGAGLGDPAFHILKKLRAENINVEYHYLDPSSKAADIFKSDAMRSGLDVSIKSMTIGKWEDYRSDETYDLITFFHSAYYIDGWHLKDSNVLNRSVNLLNSDGKLFFTHLDEDADYNRLVAEVNSTSTTCNSPITSSNLISLYCLNGFEKSIEVKTFTKYLDLMYVKGQSYADYEYLVEFLCDRPFEIKLSHLVESISDVFSFPISAISISKNCSTL
jgi:SAM-dependent methyltransferase